MTAQPFHQGHRRRATGSPVLAAVAFPKVYVEWHSDGALMRHRNGTAVRLFCSHCGSPVEHEYDSADHMTFFNTGFMAEPNDYPPTYHTFAGPQLDWLMLYDDLPRAEKTILIKTD